jgi:glycosyltransferase involved in cell wall biosynthesis
VKILHTVHAYEPNPGGSQEVIKQISERLAARGHEVTVVTGWDRRRDWTSLNGVEVRSFKVSGNSVTGFGGQQEAYLQFLLNFDGDVMLNFAAQCWSTDLVFKVLDQLPYKKVLVPCGYSALSDPSYERYFSELPAHLAKYDALVYPSENYQDKKFGDSYGVGGNAIIIPNGAAAEEFDQPVPSFREKFDVRTKYMLLSVSNHHRLKGHARLLRAVKALERDDVSVVFIGGRGRMPWRGCYVSCRGRSFFNPRLKVLTGLPREDIVAAYKDADIFIFASRVECSPLVIYEAMAAGLPFVSTDCGNVRDNSKYGIVVDSHANLAAEIADLLADDDKRNRMGRAGHQAWRTSFTWEAITDAYEALYRRLVIADRRLTPP